MLGKNHGMCYNGLYELAPFGSKNGDEKYDLRIEKVVLLGSGRSAYGSEDLSDL